MSPIELLSPAKNRECGEQAILHGADAVYIGGPQFGARSAAGNSLTDIAALVRFAHIYGARVYVTLNTILYDDEVPQAVALVRDLYNIGVDALITQDFALLNADLPPIPLHASTQMNTRTPRDVQMLEAAGFEQVVLARELPLPTIREIRAASSVRLEAFVHGALCVSYSGRCYASQYCFSRSANRGECAQFCRLAFNLENADGTTLERDRYLLSLRDMNRMDSLEEMIDAGVYSFKIEGRLKDVEYVKNVTAAYRLALDRILARRPDLQRASRGDTVLHFTPNVAKTFNRQYTDYFLHGATTNVASPDTPKATGEPVGTVLRVDHRQRTVVLRPLPDVEVHTGDGLCFFRSHKLFGGAVNRVEEMRSQVGNVFRLTLTTVEGAEQGAAVFRNFDNAFVKTLRGDTAERRIDIQMHLSAVVEPYAEDPAAAPQPTEGFRLTFNDFSSHEVSAFHPFPHQPAKRSQADNIDRQLSRLGGTPFHASIVAIDYPEQLFIPSSVLSTLRQQCTQLLTDCLLATHPRGKAPQPDVPRLRTLVPARVDYDYNVANARARAFLENLGTTVAAPAYELSAPKAARLMTCCHCIRRLLGRCLKTKDLPTEWRQPLFLRLPDGRRFPLRFDCEACEMSVWAE